MVIVSLLEPAEMNFYLHEDPADPISTSVEMRFVENIFQEEQDTVSGQIKLK